MISDCFTESHSSRKIQEFQTRKHQQVDRHNIKLNCILDLYKNGMNDSTSVSARPRWKLCMSRAKRIHSVLRSQDISLIQRESNTCMGNTKTYGKFVNGKATWKNQVYVVPKLQTFLFRLRSATISPQTCLQLVWTSLDRNMLSRIFVSIWVFLFLSLKLSQDAHFERNDIGPSTGNEKFLRSVPPFPPPAPSWSKEFSWQGQDACAGECICISTQ